MEILTELTQKIIGLYDSHRNKIAHYINQSVVQMYFEIGKYIFEYISENSISESQFFEQISEALINKIGDKNNFSKKNLILTYKFYKEFKNIEEVEFEHVKSNSWNSILTVVDAVLDNKTKLWYLKTSAENLWSSRELKHQIDSNFHQREASSNIREETEEEVLKSPYVFDFLGLKPSEETNLEQSILNNLQDFIIELGSNFSFIKREYKLVNENNTIFIDLLFYNNILNSFIAIEIKDSEFKPEFAGHMNYILSMLDKELKGKKNNPTIGIILSKGIEQINVEHALKSLNRPIYVGDISDIKDSRSLSNAIKQALPSDDYIEEFNNQNQ